LYADIIYILSARLLKALYSYRQKDSRKYLALIIAINPTQLNLTGLAIRDELGRIGRYNQGFKSIRIEQFTVQIYLIVCYTDYNKATNTGVFLRKISDKQQIRQHI